MSNKPEFPPDLPEEGSQKELKNLLKRLYKEDQKAVERAKDSGATYGRKFAHVFEAAHEVFGNQYLNKLVKLAEDYNSTIEKVAKEAEKEAEEEGLSEKDKRLYKGTAEIRASNEFKKKMLLDSKWKKVVDSAEKLEHELQDRINATLHPDGGGAKFIPDISQFLEKFGGEIRKHKSELDSNSKERLPDKKNPNIESRSVSVTEEGLRLKVSFSDKIDKKTFIELLSSNEGLSRNTIANLHINDLLESNTHEVPTSDTKSLRVNIKQGSKDKEWVVEFSRKDGKSSGGAFAMGGSVERATAKSRQRKNKKEERGVGTIEQKENTETTGEGVKNKSLEEMTPTELYDDYCVSERIRKRFEDMGIVKDKNGRIRLQSESPDRGKFGRYADAVTTKAFIDQATEALISGSSRTEEEVKFNIFKYLTGENPPENFYQYNPKPENMKQPKKEAPSKPTDRIDSTNEKTGNDGPADKKEIVSEKGLDHEKVQKDVALEIEKLRNLIDWLNTNRAEKGREVYEYVMRLNEEKPDGAPDNLAVWKQDNSLFETNPELATPSNIDGLFDYLIDEANARVKFLEVLEVPERTKKKDPNENDGAQSLAEQPEGKSGEGDEGEIATDSVIFEGFDVENISLDDLRSAYHELRYHSGRVLFRGKKVEVGGFEFKARNPRHLKELGKAYNAKLSAERQKEMDRLAEEKGLEGVSELSPEQREAMFAKMLELQEGEQAKIDEMLKEMGDKDRWKKFRRWWNKGGVKIGRILGGFGLAGTAATGGALGIASGGIRGVLSGMGVYFGAEATMEKWGGWSQKGYVNEVIKETHGMRGEELEAHINSLDGSKVKTEVDRLRALQIDKSTSLEEAGIISGRHHDREVLRLLIERNYDLIAKEVVEAKPDVSKEEQLADAMGNYLKRENAASLMYSEKASEEERKKKIKRKATAAILGGTVGVVVGSKAIDWFFGEEAEAAAPGDPIKIDPIDRYTPPSEHPDAVPMPDDLSPPDSGVTFGSEYPEIVDIRTPEPEMFEAGDLTVEVGKGESLWTAIEQTSENGGLLEGFSPEAQTHFVDFLKDEFAEFERLANNGDVLASEALKEAGFVPRPDTGFFDIDYVTEGQKLNLGVVFNNDSLLERALSATNSLTPEELRSIALNNETILEWHQAHPDVFLDSETVGKVLETGGDYDPSTVADASIPTENISAEPSPDFSGDSVEQVSSVESSPEVLEPAYGGESTEATLSDNVHPEQVNNEVSGVEQVSNSLDKVTARANSLERTLVSEIFGDVDSMGWDALRHSQASDFMEHDYTGTIGYFDSGVSDAAETANNFQEKISTWQNYLKDRGLNPAEIAPKKSSVFNFQSGETLGDYVERLARKVAESEILSQSN